MELIFTLVIPLLITGVVLMGVAVAGKLYQRKIKRDMAKICRIELISG